MIVCPKCNKELEDGAKFCVDCGTPIIKASFCPKCGKEISAVGNNKFCLNCGYELIFPANSPQKNNKFLYSVFLMIASSPIMLMLRFIFQETGIGYGWTSYTYTYVPDNLKGVMVIILMLMLLASIFFKVSSGEKSRKANIWMTIGYILSGLISFVLIFPNW